MDAKLHELLNRDLGTVGSLFPADFQGWVRDMVADCAATACRSSSITWKARSEKEARRFLKQKGDDLLARDLQSFLAPDQYDALRVHVRKGVRDIVRSEEVCGTLAAFIDRVRDKIFDSGVTLRGLIPASLMEMMTVRLEQEITTVLEGLLQDPRFREHLKQKMEGAFKESIGSIHGVTGFFASAVETTRATC